MDVDAAGWRGRRHDFCGELATECRSTASGCDGGHAWRRSPIERLRSQSLRNALNRTTSDLSSRESLIARLNLLVGQLKEASGIAEQAGLVLLTLADQNSVAFKVSQSTLNPDQRERLAENLVLIQYARTFPTFEIQITGHTDDTWEGKADHSASSRSKNQDLSLKRAEAVKQFLVDHQIRPTRFARRGVECCGRQM